MQNNIYKYSAVDILKGYKKKLFLRVYGRFRNSTEQFCSEINLASYAGKLRVDKSKS